MQAERNMADSEAICQAIMQVAIEAEKEQRDPHQDNQYSIRKPRTNTQD